MLGNTVQAKMRGDGQAGIAERAAALDGLTGGRFELGRYFAQRLPRRSWLGRRG